MPPTPKIPPILASSLPGRMCPPPVTGPHGDWLPHPPRVGRRDGQRPRGWVPLATGGTLPRWGCRCSPVPPRFQLPEPRGTTLGISCPDVASAGYGHHRDGGAGCWGLCTLGVTPAVVALPACACPPQKKARPVPAPRMGHPTADGPQGRPAVPRAMCRWDAVAPVARVVPMPPGSRRGDGVTAEPQPGAGVAPQPWPVTGAGRPPPRP